MGIEFPESRGIESPFAGVAVVVVLRHEELSLAWRRSSTVREKQSCDVVSFCRKMPTHASVYIRAANRSLTLSLSFADQWEMPDERKSSIGARA